MTGSALELKDVSYAYRTDWLMQRVPCIKNINLTIDQGESFGFLGHNGAGKTTTIKCILNLVQAQKGQIQIFGKDSKRSESRISVGYLPEQPYFYDYLSVGEIMNMYAALAGISKKDRRKKVIETLEKVRLIDRLKSRTRSLSKGLTQRLAMAQAIIGDPKLLILDEPFSGLDPLGRKEFVDLLQSLKDQGTTLFMCSHILSDVEHICERVSIMVKGEIKGVYSLRAIGKAMHGHHELTLRTANKDSIDSLPKPDTLKKGSAHLRLCYNNQDLAQKALREAVANNLPLESFQFVHGGLEDLFVKLVEQSNDEASS